MRTATRVHVRWMIRHDWPAVRACGIGWTLARTLKHLKQRNVIGMVAEDAAGEVVGVLVYRLGGREGRGRRAEHHLRLLALAVHPDHRRQGVGSALLAKLRAKCGTHRKTAVVVTVPESALPAQLALRSAGYVCERVFPARFGEESGYRFVLTVGVRWAWRGGEAFSRCGRWRVYHDGRGWMACDIPARQHYYEWPSPAGAQQYAEDVSRRG